MKIIERLKNTIVNMIKIGVITLAGSDSGAYNRTQVSYLGKTKNTTVWMPYGLDANIPKDSLMLLFNVQGQEENMIGIGHNAALRFKNLAEGEVAIGNPKTGSKIYFKANGDIEVESDGVVNINGDTEPIIRGTAFKTLYDAHTHAGGGAGVPNVAMSATQLSSKNFTE